MTAPMTPAAADWIYTEVLTLDYRRSCVVESDTPAAFRICACQYGECGWCKQRGNHERCTTRDGKAVPYPETWIGGAPVWLAGATCRWICPCEVCRTPVEPVGQLELFSLAGGAR